jgi:hypothetical protein
MKFELRGPIFFALAAFDFGTPPHRIAGDYLTQSSVGSIAKEEFSRGSEGDFRRTRR